MSTQRALAELRRKKRCIERAIRTLEEVQRLEESAHIEDQPQSRRLTGTSNLIELPRRRQS